MTARQNPLRKLDLDRSYRTPLPRQIAAQIRSHIARGDLRPGEKLPSLRSAAERWGVHFQTVQSAYDVLEEDGLVETVPRRGTRVSQEAKQLSVREDDLRQFVRRIESVAAARFGMSRKDLMETLELLPSEEERDVDPPVWVVECSATLASHLAGQIRDRFDIDARPWSMQRGTDIPPGLVVGTLYHVPEMRNLAVSRAHLVHIVPVQVDGGPLDRILRVISGETPRIILYGADRDSAMGIASEVREVVGNGLQIDLEIGDEPASALQNGGKDVPILFSPESWDRLDESMRADPRAFSYRTVIPPEALEALGTALGLSEN